MKKRAWIAGALAVAMVTGGCSTSGSTKPQGAAAPTSSAAAAETSAGQAGGTTGEVIEFEWWHALESQYEPIVNQIVEEFNASQDGIKVKPMYIGNYAALNEAIVAANATGTGLPGLAMANIPYVTSYGSGGLCEDLEPYMAADGFDINDFGDGMVKAAQYDGKQVALPFLVSTEVMFYNKDMADEKGIQIPERWDNMEEFLKTASKVGADGTSEVYGTVIPGWITWYYEPFFINNGMQMITADNVTDLDSPKSVEMIKQIKDWCKKGYTYLAVGDDAASVMRERFIAKEAFSVIYTSSLYNTMVSSCDFEVGMAWLPGGDTKRQELGGNVLFIPAKNDKAVKDAAWKFMSYLESKEVNMLWATETGYLPIRKSIQETEEGKKFLEQKPVFQVIFDNLDVIEPGVQHPAWNQVSTAWKNYMELVITEDVDIDGELAKMAQEINEILEDFQ